MLNGPSIVTRRPGSPQKSNLELTKSLRNNFRAAQQDYSPLGSPASSANGDFSTNGKHRMDILLWSQLGYLDFKYKDL